MELNSKKRISINVIFSVLQVGFVGLIYFLIYRIILDKIGIEQLGVWSLILATTSVVNLANFGITSGIVKFIAEYNFYKNVAAIKKVIFTSFIILIAIFSLFSLILYLLGDYFLSFVVEEEYFELTQRLFPISLFSLILNSVSGVFTSVLEGLQKNYLKNILLTFSSILFLIFILLLIDGYGLIGVAYSQLIQSVFMLGISYLIVAFEYKDFLIIYKYWDKKTLLKVTGFGLKFQFISILVMLFDPITKAFLSKFGGLAFLGYYEMANKLIFQVRSFIVNANQVMIPVLAHTIEEGSKKMNELYIKNYNITFLVNSFLLSILFILTPLISYFWIGELQNEFIFCMYILIAATFINILNTPAYFSCIAKGELKILIISHLILTVLNSVLGYTFGLFYGGKAVIFSSAISLIISSVYIIYKYNVKIDVRVKLKSINKIFFTSALLISLTSISLILFYYNIINIKYFIGLSFFLIVALCSVLIVTRKKIKKQIFS